MIGKEYSSRYIGQNEVVHTGLYSKKAARLLDLILSEAYLEWLKFDNFIVGAFYCPQNMEDKSEHKRLKRKFKASKPHMVGFTSEGEVTFTLNSGRFYSIEGKPSRTKILRHLDILFSWFYAHHAQEQNMEMERLRTVLSRNASKKKYADLYGIPFNPFKVGLMQEQINMFNDDIEFKKECAHKWNQTLDVEEMDKYERRYSDAIYDRHRIWWKMYLMME